MSAGNALDCHLAHVILASKCKALTASYQQYRWTYLSTITGWTNPICFRFTHSSIPIFPSLLISLPKLPQNWRGTKYQLRCQPASAASSSSCKQVPKAEMQTLALNGELDLNCKKAFLKKIKHKAGPPVLSTKENTSVALQSLLPRYQKHSVSYLRLTPHKLSTQLLTGICWTKLG